MGLRSSSLAKKHDDTLTWVLHKRDPSQQESNQRSHESENDDILVRKSYAGPTASEYQGKRMYTDHVQRTRRSHIHSNILDYVKPEPTYGYGITDLDDFLSKASIGRPGNIPMVLCTGCLLYQTQLDDHYQTEVALPLGMVVNAVFKNEQWLYVQTPHAEEGYIPYGSCLPLGIVPPPDTVQAPCWETQSDVFPRPVGDRRRLGHHRHRQHHHHQRRRSDGHRGRAPAARLPSDGKGFSGGGDDPDDAQCDVAALLLHRGHCARPPLDDYHSVVDEHDGGWRQWSWTDGRAKTAVNSITGYGYL
ncbi:uncharacterized protein LOC112687506 [Sipha flava]|uniref:Uncharacterized protein LOC112687506 n=2 Tax=Sipha flava TaxID=143950 RepID=A0A8B8FYH2_9HEMI|nr:uncharacterized protein LOC112687506 [Sipha flava]XP_025416024.1 uncharacterized protein LOC112687506 [Sipha flava]